MLTWSAGYSHLEDISLPPPHLCNIFGYIAHNNLSVYMEGISEYNPAHQDKPRMNWDFITPVLALLHSYQNDLRYKQ